MIIFLLGFMGSGKSTLGKRLAKKMSWEFLDMDKVLEEQEGMTVTQIFQEKGEAYFREAETQFLQGLDPSMNRIVATGGGAPCHTNNMDLMN